MVGPSIYIIKVIVQAKNNLTIVVLTNVILTYVVLTKVAPPKKEPQQQEILIWKERGRGCE